LSPVARPERAHDFLVVNFMPDPNGNMPAGILSQTSIPAIRQMAETRAFAANPETPVTKTGDKAYQAFDGLRGKVV
jgi:hypothetical protein